MGRLPALARPWWPTALLATLLLAGCEEKADVPPPPPMTGRSNALVAKPAVTAAASVSSAPQAPRAAAPRKLCSGQDLRAAPKASPKAAAAPGTMAPSLPVGFGVGKWVWVNLWAAWCAPCKEEIPRLIAWKERFGRAGVLLDLAFVSLDDDERQMRRFIESQPEGGLRATYYLPEGEDRNAWLRALGLRETANLPVHALINPGGQVTCTILGAVEDGDFEALRTYLTGGK